MIRAYGRGPRGHRVLDKAPQGHRNTMTLLAALRHDRIEAPCVFDGAINAERFQAYVEQALVPALGKGDVVIMDNLSSHKGVAVRRAIRKAGTHLLFLPKYPPTSTRSSRSSPSSRASFARPPSAASRS